MADLTNNEREAIDELLGDDELEPMLKEAARILRASPRRHEYTDPDYKGGPRNIEPERLQEASVELTAARIVYEEMGDRAIEATILLYEKMEEFMLAGIPVDFIAEQSGFTHRSSVYRAVRKQLPKMRKMRSRMDALIRGGHHDDDDR